MRLNGGTYVDGVGVIFHLLFLQRHVVAHDSSYSYHPKIYEVLF